MAITSKPNTTITLLASQLASSTGSRNDLICGSLLGTATAVSGQLYDNVLVKYTKTELDTLFGINTDLRNRIIQISLSNGGYSPVDVLAVDEAGTASSGSIVFGSGSGVATSVGNITISLIDNLQFKVVIPVAIGDTDVTVSADIVTALSIANFPTMPMLVTQGANTHTTDFDAVDEGTIGNFYKIKIEGTIGGLGTVVLTQPTGGATNPSLAGFFSNVQSTRFTGINWPTAWLNDLNVVITFLDSRFNSDNSILDGVAFMGSNDTFSNNLSLVEGFNSQSLSIGGNAELNNSEIAYFKPADWDMAYFQGIRSRRLTQDAPIASFITTTAGILDAFGGPALASLPYFNSPLKQTSTVNPNSLYSTTEQGELETAGFSVLGVNASGNAMITSTMVTTYTEDNAGNPNESFHFLNYVDTASLCREYFFNNIKSRFSQSRLTNGTLVAGRSIENEESISIEFIKLFKDLSKLALTIAGDDALIFFETNLVLDLDLANRKVTASFQLPIVTQLGEMIISAQLNFNFTEA